MQERAFADPKLEIIWNSEVAAINGADRLESITLRDTVDRPRPRARRPPGLFIAIGHDPRSELLKGQVDLDDEGYVAGRAPVDRDQPARRLRLRRPGRPPLPPGDHRRRHRLRRGPGRRALPRRARPRRRDRRRGQRPCRRRPADRDRARPPGLTRPSHRRGAEHPSADPVFCRAPTPTSRRNPRGEHRCRDRRRVRGAGAQVRQARPGRLLGRVVRPVPPGRPDPRRDRERQHGDKITFVKMNVDENPVTRRPTG